MQCILYADNAACLTTWIRSPAEDGEGAGSITFVTYVKKLDGPGFKSAAYRLSPVQARDPQASVPCLPCAGVSCRLQVCLFFRNPRHCHTAARDGLADLVPSLTVTYNWASLCSTRGNGGMSDALERCYEHGHTDR